MVAEEKLGAGAIKPDGWDRTGWEKFQYFLHDPHNGTFLSRTPLSWLQITIFYTIYFSCLAAFWYGCLLLFFQTIPEMEAGPKWQQGASLIGANPGVGMRPRSRYSRIGSTLLRLESVDNNTILSDPEGEGDLTIDYARRVEKFLSCYQSEVDTRLGYKPFHPPGTLGDCGSHPYGYYNGGNPIKPCIFLKLNKIWDWNPTPITEEDFQREDWPEDLKKHFDSLEDKDEIFVDCQGRNSADREAVREGLTYFPASRGFPASYFPFRGNTHHYHSPLVALQFDASKMRRFLGQLVHVECRVYYQGVVHNTRDKAGMVQFEILIEEKLLMN